MKKRFFALSTACLVFSCSLFCNASELSLEQRVSDLEQRIEILEQMLGVSTEEITQNDTEAPNDVTPAADAIALSTGTWIVGEDIAPGKYNLTCPTGSTTVYLYNSYEEKREDIYNCTEMYNMASESYIQSSVSSASEDLAYLYESIYSTLVSNVRLDDGMCIYIDGGTIELSIVQLN